VRLAQNRKKTRTTKPILRFLFLAPGSAFQPARETRVHNAAIEMLKLELLAGLPLQRAGAIRCAAYGPTRSSPFDFLDLMLVFIFL
jgi:hypothetical protein